MRVSEPLKAFGVFGLVAGCVAVVASPLGGPLAGLLATYGVLVAVAAGYLLVGMRVRAALRRRRAPRAAAPAPARGSDPARA